MDELTRLQKIDLLRERTGLGYAEVADILDEAGGDLIEALVLFESRHGTDRALSWPAVKKRIAQLLKQGSLVHVRVKKDDRVIFDLPVTAGLVGTLIAPELAVLGAAACLFARCSIELLRPDGGYEVHRVGSS